MLSDDGNNTVHTVLVTMHFTDGSLYTWAALRLIPSEQEGTVLHWPMTSARLYETQEEAAAAVEEWLHHSGYEEGADLHHPPNTR